MNLHGLKRSEFRTRVQREQDRQFDRAVVRGMVYAALAALLWFWFMPPMAVVSTVVP